MIGHEKNPVTNSIDDFFGIEWFKNATLFTKEELSEKLIGKYRVYNDEAFILTEYQAHQFYDKENFNKWLSSLLANNEPIHEEVVESDKETVGVERRLRGSVGRPR